jgi:hypothetical protein
VQNGGKTQPGIYVEIFIREKLDRIWQLTQEPELQSRSKSGNDNKRLLQIHEYRIAALLNIVVVVAVAAVAYTDWVVVVNVSLGYLYVLPIAQCALVNPVPLTIGLTLICTFLQDLFGPAADTLALRIAHNAIDLVGFLVMGFLVTQIAKQQNQLAEEVRRQRDEFERDLVLAAQVQRQVLPKPATFPGLEVAATMQTARLLGGGYYDFFQISDDVVDVVVADVSGKGAAAALLMPSPGGGSAPSRPRAERPRGNHQGPRRCVEAGHKSGNHRHHVLCAFQACQPDAAIRQRRT